MLLRSEKSFDTASCANGRLFLGGGKTREEDGCKMKEPSPRASLKIKGRQIFDYLRGYS
ncbi:hypothetical protein BFAG_03867 [Bacteroides fragilis 3_1_12]|uniref:Uncharacterized protein n=1 Tax=Bacteroides fragilis 3_1_12 TaxID=457424 RepID=A0ABN0BQT3_BACFG|nr:hypothetical protein BFAG_03867 [Bacteroides fragilis 3_1_12]